VLQKEMVYTYVGDVVVSVNPFKNTGCVGAGIRERYKGGQRTLLPPHIYALVDQTCARRVDASALASLYPFTDDLTAGRRAFPCTLVGCAGSTRW
jgi:hypothetical protein